MFSPSLVSMILHSLWSDLNPLSGTTHSGAVADVQADLNDLLVEFRDSTLPMPSVPVVGRSSDVAALGKHVQLIPEDARFPGPQLVYGRVPVDALIRQFRISCLRPAAAEYLDLGTPLDAQHFHPTARQQCFSWLTSHLQTAVTPVRMTVALIDRGVALPSHGVQETLGGRLQHLLPDVDFSEHASLVLTELIGRLAMHGLVNSCDLVCALIKPPNKPVGRECFSHANVVELEQAIQAVHMHITASSVRSARPLVTNVSMGTHVGPHDGESPLEEMMDRLLPFAQQRYLVCSAGNDAFSGRYARCELRNGSRDFMRIETSGAGCRDLLVEFWWEEPQQSSLTLSARICDKAKRPIGMPLVIETSGSGPYVAGKKLAIANAGFRSVVCESLYHARCQGGFSCVAFAMSASAAMDLAQLTIDIQLRCGANANVSVNAWIVLADNAAARFVAGTREGSITVPATFPMAISVAGVEDVEDPLGRHNAQPWQESSRGPAADYRGANGSQSSQVPKIAHRVDGTIAGFGTSFAAPRAAADAVHSILVDAASTQNPLQVQTYANSDQLARSIVARHGGRYATSKEDRDRIGFGAVI